MTNRKILITVQNVSTRGELNTTRAASGIWESLPIQAKVNTWGEEIYFPLPVSEELENGREVMEPGELGYWPEGKAFCIFFGPTPASRGREIRAASPVTVIGKIPGIDADAFKGIKDGAEIIIERMD